MSRLKLRDCTTVAFTVALLLGCDADRPSPTSSDSTPDASFRLTRADEARLNAREQSERNRIKLESARSSVKYDSLRAKWDREQQDGSGHGKSKLVACQPLRYSGEVKIIGPQGGHLNIGPHKLFIPKGALDQHVVITGEMPASLIVEVKLSPHGLVFHEKPKLALNYRHCQRRPDLHERVAYIDAAHNILEWPRSSDSSQGIAFAWIGHFSSYAVAHGWMND